MKTKSHKIRLTILSVVAIVAYVCMVGSSFISEIDDFYLGIDEGHSHATNDKLISVYFLNFQPKNGYLDFPDSMINLRNNKYVKFRSHYVKAKVRFQESELNKVKSLKVARDAFGIISIVLLIYIPILIIRFLLSLSDEIVFKKKNIRILKQLGISLILYYIIYYAFYWYSFKINQTLFDFANYKITQSFETDFAWVLVGVFVLLFAEILSKGSEIQEEQDLTI